VFRIKYKNMVGGDEHYKKDIIFIKDFRQQLESSGISTVAEDFIDDGSGEEDDGEVTDSTDNEDEVIQTQPTGPKLVLGQAPAISVDWWQAVRGTFPENGLEEAIQQFTECVQRLKHPSRMRFLHAVQAGGTMTNKAEEVLGQCRAETDRQLMTQFSTLATKAVDLIVGRQEQYLEQIEHHAKTVSDYINDSLGRGMETIDQCRERINLLMQQPQLTDEELAEAQ